MKVDYLGFVAYMHTMQKHAFLFSTQDTLQTVKEETGGVWLFGTGYESFQARAMLESMGIAVRGYLDNFKKNIGSTMRGQEISSPYEYFQKPEGLVVIAVPKSHINEVRLQFMIYHIERYCIFFLEDFHSFLEDGEEELHTFLMEGINRIALEGRDILDAVPYVQISSGLDGAKLGIINYLIYSTTWSHYVYRWLYEEYGKGTAQVSDVLEIGPGHGLLSYVLKKYLPEGASLEWICFDSKDKIRRESNENYDRSLDVIRDMYPNDEIMLEKGYIESDRYQLTKQYDAIIMTEVFEHWVTNPLPVMKKLAAALKSDGRVFLTTPNWGHLYMYDSWKEMKDYKDLKSEEQYLSMYAGHTYQYSRAELDEIFALAGLEVVKYALSDSNNHNYLLEKV